MRYRLYKLNLQWSEWAGNREQGLDVNKAVVDLCHYMAVNLPVKRKEVWIVVDEGVLDLMRNSHKVANQDEGKRNNMGIGICEPNVLESQMELGSIDIYL